VVPRRDAQFDAQEPVRLGDESSATTVIGGSRLTCGGHRAERCPVRRAGTPPRLSVSISAWTGRARRSEVRHGGDRKARAELWIWDAGTREKLAWPRDYPVGYEGWAP
jgi:hypothetical protein